MVGSGPALWHCLLQLRGLPPELWSDEKLTHDVIKQVLATLRRNVRAAVATDCRLALTEPRREIADCDGLCSYHSRRARSITVIDPLELIEWTCGVEVLGAFSSGADGPTLTDGSMA